MPKRHNLFIKNQFFHIANVALREGAYRLAVDLYVRAYQENTDIEDIAFFNIQYALRHLEGNVIDEKVTQILLQKRDCKSKLNRYREEVVLTDKGFSSSNIITTNDVYTSKDNDPYFVFKEEVTRFHPGLYGLSFDIYSEESLVGQIGKLYVDYGEGFSEDNCFTIPLKKGLNERVLHLSASPIALRFDPLETKTTFSIINFQLSTINVDTIINYFAQIFEQFGYFDFDNSLPILDAYLLYNNLINDSNVQVGSYEHWIAQNESDRPYYDQLQFIQNQFQDKPLFSIIIPTYNTEAKYLRYCLDSILNQSFSNFEVCIADDASTLPEVKEVLEAYRSQDLRIKVVYRQENGHISRASNSALEIALGQFIVLVDHDDTLDLDALYYCAKVIIQKPEVKVIYSDEDKIDETGVRSEPHFKSDWNPDLLFSQNYVSHLGVYEHKLIKTIGGFRTGVEGSQDYDLLLRCLPYVNSEQIVHIPRILYHWRAIEGSTATDAGEKSYTTDAGIKALQDYFDANGPKNTVVEMGKVPNTYKINWPIPTPNPKVSMLIPTRDGKDITEQAVRSILDKTTYTNYDILIIDNGSQKQETFKFFEQIQAEDERVKVIRYDQPFNYSAINNFGVKQTDGEIIGLINNDVEVINPEWLTEMVRHAIRPDIGCVGAKLYFPNGQIQHAGVITSLGGVAGHSHKYFPREAVGYFHRLILVQDLTAVTAACLLVKRSIYDEVGGLNENDLTVAFNDVDFCLKVYSAGYRNLWTPYAELYHYESISRGAEDNPEKIARFNKEIEYMKSTWTQLLTLDPNYSPNLTKAREDFSIKF